MAGGLITPGSDVLNLSPLFLRGEVEIRAKREFRVRGKAQRGSQIQRSRREPLTPPSPRKSGARERTTDIYAATRCAAMIWSAARPVTSAMRSNCRVKLPAPFLELMASKIDSPISPYG